MKDVVLICRQRCHSVLYFVDRQVLDALVLVWSFVLALMLTAPHPFNGDDSHSSASAGVPAWASQPVNAQVPSRK